MALGTMVPGEGADRREGGRSPTKGEAWAGSNGHNSAPHVPKRVEEVGVAQGVWQHPGYPCASHRCMSMGAAKMRPGKRGRLVTRVVLVATLAAAVIGGFAVATGTDMATLSDVFWGYSANR